MKWYGRVCLALALTLALAACGAGRGPAAEDGALRPPVCPGDNLTEHEAAGCCGSAVTTVSREDRVWDEPWEASFWGDDSAALTDLLLHLDYSGGVCRCLPEYSVDTELGMGYGVNLTEGYGRRGDGQADLTEEQVKQIREILERQGETP